MYDAVHQPKTGLSAPPFLPGSLVLPSTLSSTLLSTRYLLWGTTGDHVTRCRLLGSVGGGCELPVLERDRLGFQVLSGGHSNTGREAGHAQVSRDVRGECRAGRLEGTGGLREVLGDRG